MNAGSFSGLFHNPGSLDDQVWWESVANGIETTIEINSCHNSYEREELYDQQRAAIKVYRKDRNAAWLLRQGYKYGFVCNSDGHKGHVGTNGVTAIFAEELTRKSIFECYRMRRGYGTTNARMKLIFTGNGAMNGTVNPTGTEKILRLLAECESPIKRIDLFRNGEPFKVMDRPTDGNQFETEIVIPEDKNAASNWYFRVTQFDNQVGYTSPIWFE